MIKEITYRKLERAALDGYPDRIRHDRLDLYRAASMWEEAGTMRVKIKYEIESVECNPDHDW